MTRTFMVREKGVPDLPQLMLATIETLKAIGHLHESGQRIGIVDRLLPELADDSACFEGIDQ